MPIAAVTTALALTARGRADGTQLAVQAQSYALADYALSVIGLARPGCENEQQTGDFTVDDDNITQMKEVVHTRGVKQRLEDDFQLQRGVGDDVPVKETEADFLNRSILQLRREDVKDVIKLFDRVEKNNRKALSNDMAFQAKREVFKKKVAADDAEEKAEDDEYGTFHLGSPESYAEFEDWCQQFEYRDDEKDFSCFAGADVTRPGHGLKPDDGKFAGFDLVNIRDALHYFRDACEPTVAEKSQDGPSAVADADSVKPEPVKTKRPDLNVIKAELGKWSPALVVSSYRRLCLIKHPDKEGGSPEAFQELTENARVLTEACAKFHGVALKKRLVGKKNAAARDAKGAAKAAICTQLPEHLKTAVSFFGFTEDNFRLSSPAEIKKARQALSAEKDRKDKQIQKEKEPENLRELLRSFPEQEDGEVEDLTGRNPKQLKTMCMDLCKAHYGSVYGHIQKLK